MTITNYDSLAILPKRCSKCNRLFIFEWYNWYDRDIAPCCPPLRVNICKKCVEVKNEIK